ncbi:hypothetical protein BSL78_29150 [Apostichopus japonicus]|uniref:Uncharacterized protein n=1 Tax=Stichopus japonicus TaxID=307972 RepID=A0A2G8JE93_STIJA|nr:hypothetical protein BSL78_29150 [Apostichopus japonicus]
MEAGTLAERTSILIISVNTGWNLKWLFLVTEHPITLSPTDDYSNLQDSTDDSKVSETMTRGNSSKASKRRFLFFRRKSKDGGGGKGSSRSSSFDESSVSSRSPEPQLRRAKTLDIPDSDVSGSIASGEYLTGGLYYSTVHIKSAVASCIVMPLSFSIVFYRET